MITPPHTQFNVDVLFNAAELQISVVGEPTTQGAGVTGTHGIGVKTPSAAAVAPATAGFAMDRHIPNDGIFTIGTWSMMLAAIMLLVITVFGVGMRLLGDRPKLHCIVAPKQV